MDADFRLTKLADFCEKHDSSYYARERMEAILVQASPLLLTAFKIACSQCNAESYEDVFMLDYDGFAKFCLIAGIATDKKPDAKNVPAKIKQPTTDEDAGTDADTENEAGDPAEKFKKLTPEDVKDVFVLTNLLSEEAKEADDDNPDDEVTRYEFWESLVRAAVLMFRSDTNKLPIADALKRLIRECLVPNLPFSSDLVRQYHKYYAALYSPVRYCIHAKRRHARARSGEAQEALSSEDILLWPERGAGGSAPGSFSAIARNIIGNAEASTSSAAADVSLEIPVTYGSDAEKRDSTFWRRTRLYTAEVDSYFESILPKLKKIFKMYSGACRAEYAKKDLRIFSLPSRMSYMEFGRLIRDAEFSPSISAKVFKRIFLDSKLAELSCLRTYNHDLLSFTDFLEALGRLAEYVAGNTMTNKSLADKLKHLMGLILPNILPDSSNKKADH